MLALILPTSQGRQVELTPPGINSTAERDLNSGPKDPKPTTLTIKPTPGIRYVKVYFCKHVDFLLISALTSITVNGGVYINEIMRCNMPGGGLMARVVGLGS